MIKVAVSGLYFPMTMMEYFVRALERRNDVELFLIGPHSGSYIPWGGGMHLPPKYVRNINVPLPMSVVNQSVPFPVVANQCPDDVDLWLQIDAGWCFSDRPKAKTVAMILTDPHVLRNRYNKYVDKQDIVFCMQTPYMKPGEVYLPYAYDPSVHYPQEGRKEYDACLVGLLYQHRQDLITNLRNRGKVVYYGIGEILDEYRERYSKTKVALNWSSLDDLPARVWEYAAMGIPFVSNNITDLDTFFEAGVDYLSFTNANTGADMVEYLLNNQRFANDLAEHAKDKVKPHTYDARIEQIFKEVGL